MNTEANKINFFVWIKIFCVLSRGMKVENQKRFDFKV